jgi:tetratricopeptide (TPR) repeat protein
MFRSFRLFLSLALMMAAFALAGCESKEEKAERYFKSGMEYLEKGDEDRALIEFQNVFRYNGFHKEARKTYADIKLKRGDVQEAYSQYLRLIEQYPDTPDVRATLAEIAIKLGNWDEAERHGREALRLAPDDPRAQVIGVTLDYRKATVAQDEAARTALAEKAKALLDAHPDSEIAREVVLDNLLAGPDPMAAMPILDAAIAQEPKDLRLQMTKFRLLVQTKDNAGSGEQLKRMYAIFPDNPDVLTALTAWYLSNRDLDGAEAFLREAAGAPTENLDRHAALVQFLQTLRGPDAARSELVSLIAANQGNPNADLYGALLASLDFDAGQQTQAIESLQAIVKAAQPSDQTRKIKVILARMLDTTGNAVGARAVIEEVLAEDASNVEALKIRAAWNIQADKPGDAIVDLRTALDQNPRDVQILLLMAEAHLRDGSPDLAAERLAMAVEVSGGAAEPSLRYAQFLVQQGRLETAQKVLIDARRVTPASREILTALGDIDLRQKDWVGAQEVAGALAALGTPEAVQAAKALQASLLLGQNRTEEGLAFLEEQARQANGDSAPIAMLVQTQIRNGKLDEARATLDAALAKAPGDISLRMISASLAGMQGDLAGSEAQLRALMEEDPSRDMVVRLLYGLLAAQGRDADSLAVLDQGIAAAPDSVQLLWLKAGKLEQSGDIDGAIAIYESLYAKDSSNTVIANNLASLISAQKDDAASLNRAAVIARRLRDTDVPAFQDTYGWIAYRSGNFDEALTYLEPAAAGLPEDVLSQIHLGLAYAAAGQTDKAVAQLDKALALAGDSALPQVAQARESLAALKAGGPFTPPYVASQGTAASTP